MRAEIAVLAALLAGGGCGGGAPGTDAAAPPNDAGASDAQRFGDGAPPLGYVDFAISGCAAGLDSGADDGGPECLGDAPLPLQFTALAPSPIADYLWNFGDGTELSTSASPAHVFVLPGSYDVSLDVSGPGGSAGITVPGAVNVSAAPHGGRCDLDAQCESGACICDDTAGCRPGLERGICASACSMATPCTSGVCANLARIAPAMPEEWQTGLCLIDCAGGSPCPAGLVCRDLRGISGDDWVRACFVPEVLRDFGESCADEDGIADPGLCASGECLEEGARGLCSASCASTACPTSAACASFGDGSQSCLARCSMSEACDRDPWLACEAPGGGGSKGFVVAEGENPDGYCAPKSCSTPEECGVDGTCVAGFCTGS